MTDVADFFARFGETWVTGKVDVVDELMPADIAYHLPPFPDMDREALKGFIVAFHQGFPDFTLNTEETVVDGDTSVYRWSCRGTFTGETPLLPVSPTGNPSQASGTHVVHWRDGHPVEIWHNGDWLGWLQRAGVLPAFG